MPNFDDLILSVTARVTHETDFAFGEHKGELANRLRAKFMGVTSSGAPVTLQEISIDEEGDIGIRTDRGAWYVTANSVFLVGWLTTPGGLSEGTHLGEIQSILESILEERGGLRAELYHVRVLFSARFASREGVDLLRSRVCGAALGAVLGKRTPSAINSFRMSSKYSTGQFSDSLDLDGSKKDIQLRFAREGSTRSFASYRAFLESADLRGVVEDLRPFIEVFVSDPSKLSGVMFLEKSSSSKDRPALDPVPQR
ncbi:MAG: hypothetical protein WAK89_04780 [Candidatus Sulfotelmatobacter sp.]